MIVVNEDGYSTLLEGAEEFRLTTNSSPCPVCGKATIW